jgi:hypothetical protein
MYARISSTATPLRSRPSNFISSPSVFEPIEESPDKKLFFPHIDDHKSDDAYDDAYQR